MIQNYVRIGKVEHLSHAMMKDANDSKNAHIVMVGRSNNFTRLFIKHNLAKNLSALKVLNAHFITLQKTEEFLISPTKYSRILYLRSRLGILNVINSLL